LTAITFSTDGSVVAASGRQDYSGGVSLWNTSSCSILGILPPAFPSLALSGETKPTGRDYLFFLPDSPILILVCSFGIAVYNIVTMSIVWSIELQGITCVAVDPNSSHWAIVLNKLASSASKEAQLKQYISSILLFNGFSSTPKCGWLVRKQYSSEAKPVTINPATQVSVQPEKVDRTETEIAFAPASTRAHSEGKRCSVPGSSPLIVFTADREYSLAVSPFLSEEDILAQVKQSVPTGVAAPEYHSGFSSIFGTSARQPAYQSTSNGMTLQSKKDAWKTVFDGPSHALPPMATLCPAFLELMLEGNSTGD